MPSPNNNSESMQQDNNTREGNWYDSIACLNLGGAMEGYTVKQMETSIYLCLFLLCVIYIDEYK